MPRLAQLGGASRQMHVWYTARRKLALLTMAKRLRGEEGISLRKSTERVQVGGPVEKMCFFSNGPNFTSECFNLLY